MKIETSLNKQRAAIMRIKDIFSTAEICGLSHSEMNDRIFKIQSDLIKCPQYVKSYVSGFRDCLFDQLYKQNKVIFGMMKDGKFYSTHRNREDYYEKHGFSASEFNYQMNENRNLVGHYWADNIKPFFISAN